jgi:hypothetical protein
MRVCFIGNSLTHCNHLPLMLRQLAADIQVDFSFAALVPGGQTFEGHWNTIGDLDTLRGGDWDTVVLQEQSTRPVDDTALFLEYGGKLGQLAIERGAKLVCYQTWALQGRPEMWHGLETAYAELAGNLGARVAPAGRAWSAVLQEWPEAPLYTEDGKHPTVYGSWIAALVLAHTLFGVDPATAATRLHGDGLELCDIDTTVAAVGRRAAAAAVERGKE